MLQAVEKFERTRLSAEDWERGALDLIAAQGLAAVAVEALARQLGVTKGSFYWHFPTRDALIKAALKRWESQDTEALFAQVETIKKFRLIEHQLTAEDDELTPTMKLKRKIVNEKYKALIDSMYADGQVRGPS